MRHLKEYFRIGLVVMLLILFVAGGVWSAKTWRSMNLESCTLVATTTNSGTISGGAMSGATLSGTTTNSGTISGGTMNGATLSGTTTNSGTLSGGTVSGGTLAGGTLTGTTTNSGTISGGTMSGSTLSGTTTNSGRIDTPNGTMLTSDVTVKTGSYSVQTTDKGKVFDNYGATGDIKYTLPTWALGLFYTFTLTTAQSVYIDVPAGAMILRVTNADADSVYSVTAGDSMTLVASGVSTWTPREIGTWTDGDTD